MSKFLHCVLFAWCVHLLTLGCSWSEKVLPTSSNSFQPHILPIPIKQHMNQSTTQQLIQEVNSVFVSNTSLSDISNDSETQKRLSLQRERDRKKRLESIQQDIPKLLGMTKIPNVTGRFSPRKESLISSFNMTMIERTISSENNITTPCAEANDTC